MQSILSFLAQLYAGLALVPFIPFLVAWFTVYFITSNKKRATRISMDITSVLLLGSVSIMLHEIFRSWFVFWLLILLFLIAAGLIGRQQNVLRGSIDVAKILKILSRIGFLVLSLIYIVLVIISISNYMVNT